MLNHFNHPAVPRAALLSKERTVAAPGFNRWLLPPAALAIHLSIGMAYGFSVFWLPLSQAVGITQPVACTPGGFWQELFARDCDWRVSTLGWVFTLFFILLGISAAIWGHWLEHAGPRKAGVVSALCWSGGMLIAALGVHLHQFWLVLLGSGVIGGIGLGLGYISPVSTLLKWFPDRRGMATGMAIMGFGGGAMIGSPLASELMAYFSSAQDVGVAQTLVVLGLIYLVFMLGGAFGYRVPPSGWTPPGWTPPQNDPAANAMIARGHVHVRRIWSIPQFWLVWMVLCMNVSAGIGVLGIASPMLQEVFGGGLIGVSAPFAALDREQLQALAMAAAGFTALLSLFNIAGRFVWASASDWVGRKLTFILFFVIGALLYASLPTIADAGHLLLFVAALCIIISMYGGGFATVPAYLADLFGTQMVGAIHGRLLTAWATAGILGPVVINYMRDYQLALGTPRAQVYDRTMYILVGFLLVGLLCNLLVRPVNRKYFMSSEELARERGLMQESPTQQVANAHPGAASAGQRLTLLLAWLAVGLPVAWGVYRTMLSVAGFF